MKINLITSVDYGQLPKNCSQYFREKVDDYFYLGGKKARVIEISEKGEGIVWVDESISTLEKRLKFISYCTVFIPLIMFIAKCCLRLGQNFYEANQEPKFPSPRVSSTNKVNTPNLTAVEVIPPNPKVNPPNVPTPSRPLLNLDGFISLCAPNKQAMIYGTGACKYLEIGFWLNDEMKQKRFNDVFDFMLGQEECAKEDDYLSEQHKTSEGRTIKKIRHGYPPLSCKGDCKSGLVNIVIENYHRQRLGLPIIPIIFSVDIDHEKLDVVQVTDKRSINYTKITNMEMRRAYKLCFDPALDEGVRKVAQATFKFISLKKNKESNPVQYSFALRAAPWASQEWQVGWKNRQPVHKPKAFPWREQVRQLTQILQ